jgi:hypothetical protein
MAPDGRSFVTSVGMVEGTVWVHGDNGDRQISSEGYAEAPTLSFGGTQLFYLVRPRARGHFLQDCSRTASFGSTTFPPIRLSPYCLASG